ncbi:hypothetical protein DD865_04990, partial [Staphylococcus pseudintermedius]
MSIRSQLTPLNNAKQSWPFFVKNGGVKMVEKTLSELEKAMLKEEHIDVSTDLTLSIKLDILNQDYKIEPPQPFTTE